MKQISIGNAQPEDFDRIGNLLVRVYSALDGFPKPEEQPAYYQMLRNVGRLIETASTEIFVARNSQQELLGAVVFFGDMKDYGSGGTAVLRYRNRMPVVSGYWQSIQLCVGWVLVKIYRPPVLNEHAN